VSDRRPSPWTAIAAAALLAGCSAPPGLNSSLKEPELRQKLDAEFVPGMTLDQVQAKLDEERVPARNRRVYPGPPPQLLARLFARFGFWVDEPEFQDICYEDVWFLFGPDGKLVRVDAERRRMRVQAHQYMDPPFHTPDLLPQTPRSVPPATGGPNAD